MRAKELSTAEKQNEELLKHMELSRNGLCIHQVKSKCIVLHRLSPQGGLSNWKKYKDEGCKGHEKSESHVNEMGG